MKKYISILIAVFCFSINATAQRYSKEELENQLQTIVIEKAAYKIDVHQVRPRRGGIKPISTYSIEVVNDTLKSAVPYFGRATSIAYGGGDGLHFKAPIKSYKTKELSKGRFKVELKADSPDDHYTYILLFYPNGKVNIDVQGINREFISYQGELIKETSK